MSNIFAFLRQLAAHSDLLEELKFKSKAEVLTAASSHGLGFEEAEFDSVIWDLEARLAARRNESFDSQFTLWQTMWGKTYLEYLVQDLLPALEETALIQP